MYYCLFLLERKRERKKKKEQTGKGQKERERDRGSEAGSVVTTDSQMWGLNSQTTRP